MGEWGGYDRLLFASGCNIAHPAPLIERFLANDMPADLVDEHGFPELDDEAKALILGGNYARIHGIDTSKTISPDKFTDRQPGSTRPWSRLRERTGAAA